MTLQLNRELERLIESRIAAGAYSSAEDVIGAALKALAQDEARGDFSADEWNTLLAEAEAGGEDLDGDAVLAEIRR